MSSVSIQVTGSRLTLHTPYHPDMPGRARALGGKWDGASKAWTFDVRDEARVRALARSIYGTDGSAAVGLTVTLRLTVGDEDGDGWYAYNDGLYCAGRLIARATSKSSGARLGDGVVLLAGAVDSGGSMKNWKTRADRGTVIEIRDVPLAAAQAAVADPPRGVTVEIVSEAAGDGGVRTALEAEASSLRARLAEIERELAALEVQR